MSRRLTHCRKGKHEFTPENTYINPDKHRICRACRREYSKAYYHSNYRLSRRDRIKEMVKDFDARVEENTRNQFSQPAMTNRRYTK